MKTAIIAGVGPLEGLGAQLCMRFAMHDLHVVVAGRTREKLDHVVSEIEKSGGQASAIVCDCVDETAIAESFRQASSIGVLLSVYLSALSGLRHLRLDTDQQRVSRYPRLNRK